MSRVKSRWYIFSIVLGVVAFMMTFYVAYAEFVQWSREQPTVAVGGPLMEILPKGSITVYLDEALTDDLDDDDFLRFEIPQPQPPLDQVELETIVNKFLWLRNESAQRMFLTNICCPELFNSDGEALGWYLVRPEEADRFDPGESVKIRIELHADPKIRGEEFTIILGATGETENEE